MIAFYMQGDAICWFKWKYHNNQLTPLVLLSLGLRAQVWSLFL